MVFKVIQTNKFKENLEEALLWHYCHNLEQSMEFADQKFIELHHEVEILMEHLARTPYMGQPDEVSDMRRFPVHDGRYLVTWTVDDRLKVVTVTEFLDMKYPKELRRVSFEE